jgi:hypothetical protein
MGIQEAASALIADLIASGSFNAGEVSACDYAVLGSGAACAIVLQPLESTAEFGSFNDQTMTWGVRAECYIKDTGVSTCVLGRVWRIHDVVASAVKTGTNIQQPWRTAYCSHYNRPPDTYVRFGDIDFLPVYITIRVEESF